MGFYGLVLGTLGVWRITHLLSAEDGPGEILVRLRRALGDGFWGHLLDCFYCLSLWVALPVALLLASGRRERLLAWLAFSAGAILLERGTAPRQSSPPAFYFEDPSTDRIDQEENHELLRQSEGDDGLESGPGAGAGGGAGAAAPTGALPRDPL
jgi:hypothetical protein